MNKILLFADIHIHAHKKSFERLKDCLAALEWVFETAKKLKIKDIVFAGDLFQDRLKIDVATYSLTFDVFFKHCDGNVNLWLLLGNHDLWYQDKWDISSVLPFSALSGVTVINKACTLEIADHKIDFLPYVHDPIDHLKKFEKSPSNLLVAHLAIHGADLNSLHYNISDVILEHDGDMVKISPELFTKWEKVFLGHYHGEQIISNLEYVGSPLQLTFGEAFQEKHIIIYDLDSGKKEYIVNDFSPKHLIADDDNIDNFHLENNFIRLSTSAKTADLIEIRKTLQNKNPSTLEILPKPKSPEKEIIKDAKAILQKEDDMLKTFVENSDTGSMEKIKLIDIGMICISEQK